MDASVVVDAATDPGPRGGTARAALAAQPPAERLHAPGHFAIEVLSALRTAAGRPGHPLQPDGVATALAEIEAYGIDVDATPWSDVRRAEELSEGSLRYSDALYVAAAERVGTALLTADARIACSGAPIRCAVLTVEDGAAG